MSAVAYPRLLELIGMVLDAEFMPARPIEVYRAVLSVHQGRHAASILTSVHAKTSVRRRAC